MPDYITNFLKKFGTMLLYFGLIVLVGGLGCWISLYQYYKQHTPENFLVYLGNLGTFSISVVVLAFADAIMNSRQFGRRIWLLFLLLTMMVSLCLSAALVFLKEPFMGWVALVVVVLATIEWFAVNFYNPTFDVDEDARAVMGGMSGILPGS